MTRLLATLALAASLAVALIAPPLALAQDAKPTAKAASTPKAGKNQKVCRHKFPDGKLTTWVCDKEQPCCAWDEIRYVKCGSTITKCL